jgi:hypothetical protein
MIITNLHKNKFPHRSSRGLTAIAISPISDRTDRVNEAHARILSNRKDKFKSILSLSKFTIKHLFPWASQTQINEDLASMEHIFINKGTEYFLRYLKGSEEAAFNVILKINILPTFEKVSVGLDFKG